MSVNICWKIRWMSLGAACFALSCSGSNEGGLTNTGGSIPTGGSFDGGGNGTGGGSAALTGAGTHSGGTSPSVTGGAANSGGTGTTGGNANTGGSKPAGGAPAGGTPMTGGKTATGGTLPTGGAATGGAKATGGATLGTGGVTASGGSSGTDTVNAATMAPAMGFGANIGNTFDNTTSWETGWGEPLVTQTYINGMASRGIKTVRVPVAWNTYAVNGVIDSTKMNRVKQVVSWIEAAGMYSIVNIHWDGGWINNQGNSNQYKLTDDVKTKFASYWTQIATAFAAVGNKLIFEGMNEEGVYYINGTANGTPDYAPLNTMNQLFVTTVRAQSGYSKTRALLIGGFGTDIDKTCVSAFTIPTDPAGSGKLFLSLHFYSPSTFTILDSVASWGSPQTTWGTASDKATLQGLFDKAGAFSKQRSIPVIIGEFGVTVGQAYPRDPASRTLWMESVAKAAFSYGMVPVLWDTGSDISRSNGSFSSALQKVFTDLNL